VKDVDKMLQRARALLTTLTCALLCDNEDGFLNALCVNPEKYKRTAPDGTVGYDFLAALMDTAKEDWSTEEAPEEPEVFICAALQEEETGPEEEGKEENPVEEVPPAKRKQKYRNLFGWG
jgi:hypothetical protein